MCIHCLKTKYIRHKIQAIYMYLSTNLDLCFSILFLFCLCMIVICIKTLLCTVVSPMLQFDGMELHFAILYKILISGDVISVKVVIEFCWLKTIRNASTRLKNEIVGRKHYPLKLLLSLKESPQACCGNRIVITEEHKAMHSL